MATFVKGQSPGKALLWHFASGFLSGGLKKDAVAIAMVSKSNRFEEHAVTQVSSGMMQRNLVAGKCHDQSLHFSLLFSSNSWVFSLLMLI